MSGGDSRALALAKTLVFAGLFITLFLYWLPTWLDLLRPNFNFHGRNAFRLGGLVLFIPGLLVALRCVFNFVWTGHGTPAPFDPPRRLVVQGFYRYVRNPMYVGFGSAIVGAWILFGRLRWEAVAVMALIATATHLFVVFYEEPTLRRNFGADYEEFCRNVPRWRVRLKPWERGAADSLERHTTG